MPPSKKQKNAQKNAEKKAKAKKVAKSNADKTFGLKNKKKSKKVQQYVAQVNNQDSELKKMQEMQKRKAAEKKAAEKAKQEASKLLISTIPKQKVPFGVDPKTILCEYFKVGACTRGAHCKFSHDLNVARKVHKKDIYQDDKDEETKVQDTMDNWDEDKLRAVVKSKQGKMPPTDKVCKYFIQAVEDGKYGWFWQCPNSDPKNGKECMYRHSLPPGFVLKTKEQRRLERLAKEAEVEITLEEYIENQRHLLPKDLTPMTQETFHAWKQDHRQKRLNSEKEKENGKGRAKPLTGREVIIKKYQDKFYREEELASAEKGTEVDMTSFKNALREIEEKEMDGNIKDYGDGSLAFAEANA